MQCPPGIVGSFQEVIPEVILGEGYYISVLKGHMRYEFQHSTTHLITAHKLCYIALEESDLRNVVAVTFPSSFCLWNRAEYCHSKQMK
jgi:hypothetical protein